VSAKQEVDVWHVGETKNGQLPDGTLAIFGGTTQPGFIGNCICAFAPPLQITELDVKRAKRIVEEHNALLGIPSPAEAIAKAREALERSKQGLEILYSMFGVRDARSAIQQVEEALALLTPKP
jgi:hypothetical protein